MAALEGGVAALCVSSGQAASAMAIQNLCRPGDNVVSSTDLYGGTWNLFANTLSIHGHHRALRRSGRSGSVPPRHRRPHARLLRRDLAQSEAHGVSDRRGRRDRPLARRAADHGQHGGADDLPAARSRRRHRGALDHQIHRRPRHLDRRHDRRRRQLRLGGACQALPDAERARSELSRRGVDRGREAARADRLHHPRPRRAVARHRLVHEPVQRLPVHPGAGDAAAADARALPQRRDSRAPSAAPSRRRRASSTRACTRMPSSAAAPTPISRASAASSASS